MIANHKLGLAISDIGFYEFKRQLDYKCQMYGSNLVLVDQWFPSSKTGSNCGSKKDMPRNVFGLMIVLLVVDLSIAIGMQV
jgi:putative transposase